MKDASSSPVGFTDYQKFVVAVLAFLQFTVILDFMILAPLGAILMPELKITTMQFGLVVSAYAFSAGSAGILAAGFADRFDRKKFLLFFYAGFLIGTLFCGLASNYPQLLAARIVTGLFGGVIGSIVLAIAADLFPFQMRGRVMGVVQTAFAASQVLGIPVGLFISNHWGWHASFFMIVAITGVVGLIIMAYLQPINAHIQLRQERNAFRHLFETVSKPLYLQAFATSALLSTGGFMLMPFSSAFSVKNLGIGLDRLPMVYLITGVCNIAVGPLMGRLADTFGKFKVFSAGSILGIATIVVYTHLGVTPLATVILISVLMFTAISSRMISASALMSAIPDQAHRGSFMSMNASIQQISGGFASALAGVIVVQSAAGPLERFDLLGYVVCGAMAITVVMMFFINRVVLARRL